MSQEEHFRQGQPNERRTEGRVGPAGIQGARMGWGGGGSGGDDTANNFLWSEWHDVDDVLAKVHSVLTLLRGSVIIAHLFK